MARPIVPRLHFPDSIKQNFVTVDPKRSNRRNDRSMIIQDRSQDKFASQLKLKEDRDKSADFARQDIESPPSTKPPSPKRKPPLTLHQDALLCIPYAQAGLTAHFDLT